MDDLPQKVEQANYKASGIEYVDLINLKVNHINVFNQLNFQGISPALLLVLFPQDDTFGSLPPPANYCDSAKRIRQWRRMGEQQQKSILKQQVTLHDSASSVTSSLTARPPNRGRSQKRSASSSPNKKPPSKRLSPTPPPSQTTVATQESTPGTAVPDPQSPPHDYHDRLVTGQDEIETPLRKETSPVTVPCMGISLQYLKTTVRKDVDATVKGFQHLVGQALHERATSLSQTGTWQLDTTKYIGSIAKENIKKDDKEKKTQWLLKRSDISSSLSTEDYIDAYGFSTVICQGVATDPGCSVCDECQKAAKNLFRKCRDKSSLHGIDQYTGKYIRKNSIWSPTILQKQLAWTARDLHSAQRDNQRVRLRLQKFLKDHLDKCGFDLDPNYIDEQILFGGETQKLLEEFLDSEDGVDFINEKEVIRLLFRECQVQAAIAKRSGKKRCRYSPLMIRFSIYLRMRAGKSAYSFISQVFTLPSETTLNEYSSPSASSPDGILWKTLRHQKKIFDGIKRKQPLKKVDPLRMGILKWDEMEAKEGIEADPNTGRIVGYSHESFNKNAVFAKMKKAFCATNDESEENNGEDEGSSSDPEYAKKYLAFIFDTISKTGKRFKFVAARFALRSSDGFFYYEWIPRICAALYSVGFIVVKGACDGATENRSAMKMLCDVTFGNVLERYTPTVPTTKNSSRQDDSIEQSDSSSKCSTSSKRKIRSDYALGYPPDLLATPIAFEHPSNPNILIFWDPDMPHAVKKLVNALERSGLLNHKTDLRLKGTKISLQMLKEIWEHAGDGEEAGSLLLSKLGLDHFEKNPNSRILVE